MLRSQEPSTEHEKGVWMPEEPQQDPLAWEKVPLSPITEGTEENSASSSFQTARSEPDEDDERESIARQVAWMTGNSAATSSSSPRTKSDHGKETQVLWMSRGSLVLATRLPPVKNQKRNNQILTKEEEQERA